MTVLLMQIEMDVGYPAAYYSFPAYICRYAQNLTNKFIFLAFPARAMWRLKASVEMDGGQWILPWKAIAFVTRLAADDPVWLLALPMFPEIDGTQCFLLLLLTASLNFIVRTTKRKWICHGKASGAHA